MHRESGSAMVLVLLVLGVVTLLAAGLMVQTRFDSKFNRAQGSYGKMINLADGAARIALFGVTYQTPGAYSGEATSVVIDSQTKSNLGDWKSQAWFLGSTTNPIEMAGWEIGTGFYLQYWVAQGTGNRGNLGNENALSTVQVAGIRYTK